MVKFSTDSHFVIGYQHSRAGKPCQDYTLHKNADDYAYVVLSDGCSSGGRTELGASLLSLLIGDQLEHRTMCFWNDLHYDVDKLKRLLSLYDNDFLATALYAYGDDGGIYVHGFGDGVVAAVYNDGRIDLTKFEWEGNTPYYPFYTDKKQFENYHADDNLPFCVTAKHHVNTSLEDETIIDFYTVKEGMDGFFHRFSLEGLSYLVLFSDGICQISDMDWVDAIKSFVDFRNPTGDFAKRLMIRTLKNMQRDNHVPMDDLSMAVIHVEQ
jgi:Protein phosphatase 2C